MICLSGVASNLSSFHSLGFRSPCPANGSRSVAGDAEVEFLFSVGLSALVSYTKEKPMVLGLPCSDRLNSIWIFLDIFGYEFDSQSQ